MTGFFNTKQWVRLPSAFLSQRDPESLTTRFSATSLSLVPPQHDIHQVWDNLIYTLPALSGLAKVFQKCLKDDYLAGLWKRDLLHGLLWIACPEIKLPLSYRALSWPWASVDCIVTHYMWERQATKWHRFARVMEAITIPVAQDVTGQVTEGYLRISGSLQRIFQQEIPTVDDFGRNLSCLSLDNSKRETVFRESLGCQLRGDRPWDVSFDFSIPAKCLEREMFLMPLLHRSEAEGDAGSTFGLVLYPKDDSRGTYRRIGEFETSRSSVYRK